MPKFQIDEVYQMVLAECQAFGKRIISAEELCDDWGVSVHGFNRWRHYNIYPELTASRRTLKNKRDKSSKGSNRRQNRAYHRRMAIPKYLERERLRGRVRESRNSDAINDSFIKKVLKNTKAPPDLIEAKRQQIKLFRLLRERAV